MTKNKHLQELQKQFETLESDIKTIINTLNHAVDAEGDFQFKVCLPGCKCNQIKIVGIASIAGFKQSEFSKTVVDAIQSMKEDCLKVKISESEAIVVLAALLRSKESRLVEIGCELADVRLTLIAENL